MDGVDNPLWIAAAAAVLIAITAGIADWRRRRRRDLDRIGPIYWPTIQVLALIVAAVCGALALRG